MTTGIAIEVPAPSIARATRRFIDQLCENDLTEPLRSDASRQRADQFPSERSSSGWSLRWQPGVIEWHGATGQLVRELWRFADTLTML
jgi:hypothetical protein